MLPDHSPDRVLPAAGAERVLARAAALDAARQGGTSLARLREVAAEAGIAPGALEAALSGDSAAAAPLWVRVCLFGVPDRATAMGYYRLFVALLVLAPLAAVAVRIWAPSRDAAAVPLLATTLWWLFSLWSTARAVRWADRHGWDRLP
jgi:hypothetical protein